MTRVYLAGPMNGHPDLNRTAFAHATAELRMAGYDVVNPHDLGPHPHHGDCPPSYAVSDDGHSAACYLRTCLAALLACDMISFLPGSRASVGARRERRVADWTGIPILGQTTGQTAGQAAGQTGEAP